MHIFHKISDNKKLLFKAACQISLIGAGGKNYGSIRVDDKNVVKVEDLFTRLKIKFNEKVNSKYDPNTLSARRLVRLLRYQIRDFIIKTQRPSYLWLKYSTKNINMIHISFPGGEHLASNKAEAFYLLEIYKAVDLRLNSKFIDRMKRVFIARNILAPIEIEEFISKIKIV